MQNITTLASANSQCNVIRNKMFRDEIDALIDSARINADDSLIEKSITAEQYDACFIESLGCLLVSREVSRNAVKWFEARGVRG